MECKCVNCNCATNLYKYKCETSGYNLYDLDGIKIKKLHECDIDLETDNEINDTSNIEYCSMCNIRVEYPDSYDNVNHSFTNNGKKIYYYENFLKRNIIHNFDISCKYCSNNLEKYRLETNIIEENDENFESLSFPNDFINDINIYDLNNNLIKTFKPHNYMEYKKLHELTANISKNILCCPICKFFIMNNLQEFYEPE